MNGRMKKRLLDEAVPTPLSIATLDKEAECALFAPLPFMNGLFLNDRTFSKICGCLGLQQKLFSTF